MLTNTPPHYNTLPPSTPCLIPSPLTPSRHLFPPPALSHPPHSTSSLILPQRRWFVARAFCIWRRKNTNVASLDRKDIAANRCAGWLASRWKRSCLIHGLLAWKLGVVESKFSRHRTDLVRSLTHRRLCAASAAKAFGAWSLMARRRRKLRQTLRSRGERVYAFETSHGINRGFRTWAAAARCWRCGCRGCSGCSG